MLNVTGMSDVSTNFIENRGKNFEERVKHWVVRFERVLMLETPHGEDERLAECRPWRIHRGQRWFAAADIFEQYIYERFDRNPGHFVQLSEQNCSTYRNEKEADAGLRADVFFTPSSVETQRAMALQ